ncbi:MAG TPA: DUF6498-containing protein, partial [Opitutus sp.]|nr:DUF6498-containing protein [Opitutus sp.]
FGRWQTADLVWSLWLSSLLVGYALIVWTLSTTVREFAVNAMRDRTPNLAAGKGAAGGVLVLGFLFGLAFFTVHFGGFHFVHSAFLQAFFPLEVEGRVARNFPDLQLYAEVFRQYWVFVPLAFMAEREAFRRQPGVASDTTVTPAAIKRRKEQAVGSSLMAPYKNVVRMHLLIFFFAGAHVLRLESFAIYAVVYAVYFFPWRMLRREKRKAES